MGSEHPVDGMTRRQFFAKAAAATTAGAFMSLAGPIIEKAYGAGPCPGHLTDIEHIVLLMQENRSFDHYFGTLSDTRGFDDTTPPVVFAQSGWNPMTQAVDPAGVTLPYRFDTTRGPLVAGECVNDPDHSWIGMHNSWNGGANDNWLPAQVPFSPLQGNVPVTMGFYTRRDLPIHYLLADTFTVCDGYFCSLLGGTTPNRLYWMSAWIDPDGTDGGPVLIEPNIQPLQHYSWRIPKVSWVLPGFLLSEHPAFPVNVGAVAIVDALRILLSNPAVWEKTALIVNYDENGGFFDHVVPPTPPPGTPGEFVTVPDIDSVPGSGGIRGPIGLGFRVPCLVISPYSRGPLMVHDTFDHTSTLKLIRARFGVPVPNLTAWRDATVGDMTSTFNFAAPPNPSKPNLDHPRLNALPKLPQCVPNAVLGTVTKTAIPYRVPFPQSMPTQETAPTRGIPSGLC